MSGKTPDDSKPRATPLPDPAKLTEPSWHDDEVSFWRHTRRHDNLEDRRAFAHSVIARIADRPATQQNRPYHRIAVNLRADWLDLAAPPEWVADLITTLAGCSHPGIRFLLVTRQPKNFQSVMNQASITRQGKACEEWLQGNPPPNIWLGTKVDAPSQMVDLEAMLEIPAKLRFLITCPTAAPLPISGRTLFHIYHKLAWIIAQSAKGCPTHPDHIRMLRNACQSVRIPFLYQSSSNMRLYTKGRRHCRYCDCHDEDCSGCVQRSGEPCSWIDSDLCSACAGEAPIWNSFTEPLRETEWRRDDLFRGSRLDGVIHNATPTHNA